LIVVADSSPLRYLIEIGAEELLLKLYGTVQIPREVLTELSRGKTPAMVRTWCNSAPAWLEVKVVTPNATLKFDLGAGETAAIELALQSHADLLLIDDREAAGAAKSIGLNVTGTLGVLLAAHKEGLADGRNLFDLLLSATNFYRTSRLISSFARRIAEFEVKQ
jgi:predicted nucleic acid-binding protein